MYYFKRCIITKARKCSQYTQYRFSRQFHKIEYYFVKPFKSSQYSLHFYLHESTALYISVTSCWELGIACVCMWSSAHFYFPVLQRFLVLFVRTEVCITRFIILLLPFLCVWQFVTIAVFKDSVQVLSITKFNSNSQKTADIIKKRKLQLARKKLYFSTCLSFSTDKGLKSERSPCVSAV